MIDAIIILPPDMEEMNDEQAERVCDKLRQRLPNTNVALMPHGCVVHYPGTPYYVKQTLGDFTIEIGFASLEEMQQKCPDIFDHFKSRQDTEEVLHAMEKLEKDLPTAQWMGDDVTKGYHNFKFTQLNCPHKRIETGFADVPNQCLDCGQME